MRDLSKRGIILHRFSIFQLFSRLEPLRLDHQLVCCIWFNNYGVITINNIFGSGKGSTSAASTLTTIRVVNFFFNIAQFGHITLFDRNFLNIHLEKHEKVVYVNPGTHSL